MAFVYRNRLWLPHHVGNQIYAHFNLTGGAYHPEFWIYHNSFSGGEAAMSVSGYADDNGGLPNFRFINNIFSGTRYVGGDAGLEFMTNRAMVGIFDHNLVTPPYPTYPTLSFRVGSAHVMFAEQRSGILDHQLYANGSTSASTRRLMCPSRSGLRSITSLLGRRKAGGIAGLGAFE